MYIKFMRSKKNKELIKLIYIIKNSPLIVYTYMNNYIIIETIKIL